MILLHSPLLVFLEGTIRFYPNLHTHRFWVEAENRFVKLKLCARGLRIIDKKGIDEVLAEIRSRGEKV